MQWTSRLHGSAFQDGGCRRSGEILSNGREATVATLFHDREAIKQQNGPREVDAPRVLR
jgi:hypothetical protein